MGEGGSPALEGIVGPSSQSERENQPMVTTKLHWGRILAGGFFVEVGIFVVFIPTLLLIGDRTSQIVAVSASFPVSLLFGWWVGRRAESRFMLHGLLVGVVAVVLYRALAIGQPQPWFYILGHGLKLVGAVAGARIAEIRQASG